MFSAEKFEKDSPIIQHEKNGKIIQEDIVFYGNRIGRESEEPRFILFATIEYFEFDEKKADVVMKRISNNQGIYCVEYGYEEEIKINKHVGKTTWNVVRRITYMDARVSIAAVYKQLKDANAEKYLAII